jgi:hypothetical protein
MVTRFVRALAVLVGVILLPTAALAQAVITGTVKDTSGGVLPGVTVEAASPALIEKVRSVVSDTNGAYRIVDLRPGTYTVTFTLPGFNTLKRDGIGLSGTATFVVDVELRVGALEETITVSGQAPTVDVQTSTKGRVIDTEVINTVPTGRSFMTLGVLIPSVNSSLADVGGSQGGIQGSLAAHGGKGQDQRILMNGQPVNDLQTNSAGQTGEVPNVGAFQEIAVDFGGVSAEQNSGGVYINLIPRDGGNTFSGTSFVTYANDSMASKNLTQALRQRGLTANSDMKKAWEVNPSIGGPIVRDKLWFYASGRMQSAVAYAANMYVNKNVFDPTKWTYEPDRSRPATNNNSTGDGRVRFTWQATPKNKFAFTVGNNVYCRCPQGVSSTLAPEGAADRRQNNQMQINAEWKAPLTNRVLAEATGYFKNQAWGFQHLRPQSSFSNVIFPTGSLNVTPEQLARYPAMVAVQEQAAVNGMSANLIYRGPGTTSSGLPSTFARNWQPTYIYRGALSYVSGAHNMKAGYQDAFGNLDLTLYPYSVPYRYRFNNGVPNQITLNATPVEWNSIQDHDIGIFAQDRWTIDRMTLSGGGRLDIYRSHYPQQTLGPALLFPNRNWTFPAEDNLHWNDVSWRSGWAYDLFGNQKTALRAFLNKYVQGQALGGIGSNTNPIARLVLTTTRSWNDDGNYIVDCDLVNPAANRECGPMASSAFGTQSVSQVTDSDLRTGWQKRVYNYEFSTGLQHEILPRVSLDVAYYRRFYGNLSTTDNLAVSASDYDEFKFTVPTDSRLPDGGGYAVTLYDLKPSAFGRPAQNSTVLAKRYGKQTEHWNGFDISVLGRLGQGTFFSAGTSTGKTMTDQCDVTAQVPEALFAATIFGTANANVWLPKEYCHAETPFLTQAKALGAYTIPKWDVQVAATFQSIPGAPRAANYVLSSAEAARTLGRPLSGNTANITVDIVPPGSVFEDRLNEVDLRIGKIVRFGRRRTSLNLDLYNLLNSDAATASNWNFASWFTPTTVIQARFVKFSMQVDF